MDTLKQNAIKNSNLTLWDFLKNLEMYKFWYVIGLIFMGIFFITSTKVLQPIYILLSLVCFIISAKQYENKKGAK